MAALELSKLDEWEKQIKAGALAAVQNEIERLNARSIERRFALRLANIARRIGFHRFALRVLSPIVRPKIRLLKAATPEEILEYGICLVRLGIIPEALKLFATIDPKIHPSVLAHRASAVIGQWNYADGVRNLEEFVNQPNKDEYQLFIGKVNLAEAYLSIDNFVKAKSLAQEVITWSQKSKHDFLLGYAFQVQMETAAREGNSIEAMKYLEKVKILLGKTHYRYALYTQKWKAIIDKSPKLLLAVKKEAEQRHAWEVVRDCDFYLALMNVDEKLLQKLYFGSPSPFYRERILKRFSKKIEMPERYEYVLGEKGFSRFNVQQVSLDNKILEIKQGKILHNSLLVLASDFYAPFRPENLFSILFPDECFDPESSIPRIHNHISRMKHWLKKNGVPLNITEQNSLYRIDQETTNLIVEVQVFEGISSQLQVFVDKIRNVFLGIEFSSEQAATVAKSSRSHVKRFLSEAQNQGMVEKLGRGKNVKYRVA